MRKLPGKILLRWHNNRSGRLKSLHKPNREASDVVKGINRRVVVVKSPDERIFEQAIFIVRDDYLRREPDGAKQLLSEAKKAAAEYMSDYKKPHRSRFRSIYAACGVAAAAVIYLTAHFVLGLF